MIDLLTWRSELRITNVTVNDYGSYECIARNSEGTTRYTIDLDVKSRPGKKFREMARDFLIDINFGGFLD